MLGTSSCNSESPFAPSSPLNPLIPVRLPPGRLRLATSPSSTGSTPTANTIGMLVVAALAARVYGNPGGTITATRSWTRSAANSVEDGADIQADLPRFQSVLPDDIEVNYQFDQSPHVTRAIRGLFFEGALGAVLTGLMVLLFLRDWRSSLVVVLKIPLAILASVTALWVSGQTINIMTLGGLALAVGVLVDEATVTIENIHTHLADGRSLARAASEATAETTLPRFVAMLCILAVFIPAFFMTGAAHNLFARSE